jgi:hypothetical protein
MAETTKMLFVLIYIVQDSRLEFSAAILMETPLYGSII